MTSIATKARLNAIADSPTIYIAFTIEEYLDKQGEPVQVEVFHSAYVSLAQAIHSMRMVSTNLIGPQVFRLYEIKDEQEKILIGTSEE